LIPRTDPRGVAQFQYNGAIPDGLMHLVIDYADRIEAEMIQWF
jgi:hypothetical protein